MKTQSVSDFRDAWKEAQGSTFSQRMARKSLVALAANVPALASVLAELQAPEQELLELHLDEGSIRDHAAPADALSSLLAAMSAAVKEVAKGISGRVRATSTLLVTGPAPGSVMLQFTVPPAKVAQATIDGTNVGAPDAQALRMVSQVIASAESDDESLAAITAQLPAKSRVAIKNFANTVSDQGWSLHGSLVAAGQPRLPLSFSTRAAHRLADAVDERTVSTDLVSIAGTMDGWAWSTGTLRFQPEHGRAFSAHVPVALQPRVAKLVAAKAESLTLRFVKNTLMASGTSTPLRTSYSVSGIPDTP